MHHWAKYRIIEFTDKDGNKLYMKSFCNILNEAEAITNISGKPFGDLTLDEAIDFVRDVHTNLENTYMGNEFICEFVEDPEDAKLYDYEDRGKAHWDLDMLSNISELNSPKFKVVKYKDGCVS